MFYFFPENKENLLLAWERESDHQGVLNLKWLRGNCYSEPARKIQSEMRRTRPHLGQVFSPPDNNQTMMLRTSTKRCIKLITRVKDTLIIK